jgi:pentose-5-phosphate-3-epimerase
MENTLHEKVSQDILLKAYNHMMLAKQWQTFMKKTEMSVNMFTVHQEVMKPFSWQQLIS